MERPGLSSCDDCSQSLKTMRSTTFHVCEHPDCLLADVNTTQADFNPMEWARLCFCARCLVDTYQSPPPCEYSLGGRDAVIQNSGSTEKFICPRCRGIPHPQGKQRKAFKVRQSALQAELVLVTVPGSDSGVPALQLDPLGLVQWVRTVAARHRKVLYKQVQGLSELVKKQDKAQLRERQGAGQSDIDDAALTSFLFTVEGDGVLAAASTALPTAAFEWSKPCIDAYMEARKSSSDFFSSTAHHRSWSFFASSMYGERWPKERSKDARNVKFSVQGTDDCLLPVSFTVPACVGHLKEYVHQVKVQMQVVGRKHSKGGGRGGLTSTNMRESATVVGRRVETEQPLSTKQAPEISFCTLPRPEPPARPPKGSAIAANFEKDNVVRLDISAAVTDGCLSAEDEEYVMNLCDDPDATVVIKGLTDSLNPVLWTWEYILARCGHVVWKKVRVFQKKHPQSEQWYERGWKTMSLHDYHEYLLRRQAGDPDALSSVWYWIDFPMKEYLPELYQDYQRATPLDLLPGGRYCAQQWVASSARPEMGPNLYITPPGGRTWFHEDGNGTVDSGHQCMTGQNEVIMLRRITDEPTRLNALHKLNGGEALDRARPHDDAVTSTARKQWPTKETLEYLRDDLHASPSSIVLGPGEYLHIGKGRLHAFRKKQPPADRAETSSDVCISVAWDWMYEGYSTRGISGEAATLAFNATLNEQWRRQSLSIHDSALLHGAFSRLGHLRSAQAVHNLDVHSLVDEACSAHLNNQIAREILDDPEDMPSRCQNDLEKHSKLLDRLTNECCALQPYLKKVTQSKFGTVDNAPRTPWHLFQNGIAGDLQRGKLDASRVDAYTNASMGDVYNPEAFAPAGYSCEICQAELSNEYLHCMGCGFREYDYNICAKCFKASHHLHNDKEHMPRRARVSVETECFCGAQPCMQCTAAVHGGAGCRCCMCYQVRWRYAHQDDLKALRDQFKVVTNDVNNRFRKKSVQQAKDTGLSAASQASMSNRQRTQNQQDRPAAASNEASRHAGARVRKPPKRYVDADKATEERVRRTPKRNVDTNEETAETESDETAELEVEAVVGRMVRKSQAGREEYFYRVRWKGWSPGDDTWEPLSNLQRAKNLVLKFENTVTDQVAQLDTARSKKIRGDGRGSHQSNRAVDAQQRNPRKTKWGTQTGATTEEIFTVQTILAMRGSEQTRQYKVRWCGYGPEEDTWEPLTNLGVHGSQLAVEFEKHTRSRSPVSRSQAIRKGSIVHVQHPVGSGRKYEAAVLDERPGKVLLHYKGFATKWDEWVDIQFNSLELVPERGSKRKNEDGIVQTGVSSAPKRRTQPANPKATWMNTMQGWTLKLPGSVWGLYAHDEGTQQWAKQHSNEKFTVAINKVDATGVTVQHQQEPPFVASLEALWPHMARHQKQLAIKCGVSVPSESPAGLQSAGALDTILRRKLKLLVGNMKTAAANGHSQAVLVRVMYSEGETSDHSLYCVEDYGTNDTNDLHVLHGHWAGGFNQRLNPAFGVVSPFLEAEALPNEGFDDSGTSLRAGGWSIACADPQIQAKLMTIRRWYNSQLTKIQTQQLT